MASARVCCGLTPHLELALRPDLYGRPVVVTRWRDTVVCVSPEAWENGVRPGMTQRQAQQLCPDAELLEPDPAGAERLRELLSAALYDLSPVVEVRVEGIAWIDLEGIVQPSLALRELRRRLRTATGAEPRLGLAPGPFCARLAAARARPGKVLRVEDASGFLAPLPASELALELWQMERLERLGLRTLGAVARIGPRQLESQLGRGGRLAAVRAGGLEPDHITPWQPPRTTAAHRQFEPPVEEREALLFVARALCDELAGELSLRGAGAKRVRVRLDGQGLDGQERESLFRHPLSSATELFGLVSSWLRSWQPAEPISEMLIELPELEPAGRRQLRLWVRGDGSAEEVKAALERLQERHGAGIALQVEAALPDSPIPSQRFSWRPAGPAATVATLLRSSEPRPEADPPALSRNLGDFNCEPALSQRRKPDALRHADEPFGIKAERLGRKKGLQPHRAP